MWIFLPRTPPPSFISSIASCTPLWEDCPNVAVPPVMLANSPIGISSPCFLHPERAAAAPATRIVAIATVTSRFLTPPIVTSPLFASSQSRRCPTETARHLTPRDPQSHPLRLFRHAKGSLPRPTR